MSDKEVNLAILNKLYEIADKVFNEGVNVKEGNYTASDLAKMKDSAFKDGYLETEKKSYKNECNKQVEKDCFVAPMASVNVLSFVCSFCVVQIFALVARFEKLAGIPTKEQIALLDGSANNRTQSVIPAKVDNVTTEEKEEPTDKEESCEIYYTKENGRIVRYDVGTYYKDSDSYLVSKTFVHPSECKVLAVSRKELENTLANYQITEECYNNILYQESYDITQKYLKSEKAKVRTNTPAKVVPLDKSSNKFSFDAIGVNVGDALTFIDGTKVIAAENNKIIFCGELFTLSGFCKEFMPDDKRTKSNSYRGCAFFFKDGVKLEKLFKEQQKKSLVSKEEIAAVPDDTLDNVPNEHLASEKCTEQTITPPTKENVSERKETTSTAKVVAISIGVPSCLDIPPNNMRLDIAANKPLNAAVGDCLCGVGKVVHTLPLPPPRSKEMSELITYTNFYNTS